MEYKPRYSQPFTLEEARLLAVPIITEEISRLQNSLSHLQRTQEELKEALTTAPGDPDLTEALEENEVVIGSQNERITMLKIVLNEKGIRTSAHYDVQGSPRHQAHVDHIESEAQRDASAESHGRTTTSSPNSESRIDGDTEGVYL
ncbi:hypothetical protein OH76DRAFT_1371866 [Lentinus brumalis]|uniref:Uncharacterized protein n=1 Tax=Lentinus brumalis TaxID=2498619 RepID=A0A371DSQ0_9APHY|nr:hypothetical protein OH76DRAFT_1371866 [Polyporus brumalis]